MLDKPDFFASFQDEQDRITVKLPLSKTALHRLQWLVTRTGSADLVELLERLGRSTDAEGHQLWGEPVVQPMLQQDLLLSPSQFRTFLDHAPIGIVVAQCNNYRFVLVNRTFCNMVGYSEMQMLTLNCPVITYPEDLPTEQPLAEALIAGATATNSTSALSVRTAAGSGAT